MKPLKFGLRIIIAIASLISFLAGWILFSHAGKPQPLFTSQPVPDDSSNTTFVMPKLQPIPSLNDLVTNGGSSSTSLQQLPSLQNNVPITRSRPRLRTMGS
jgi:hypothetical protein